MDKVKAIQLFKNIKEYPNMEFVHVRVSKEQLDVADAKDFMGTELFVGEKNKTGWLIFVDPNICANWSHRCEYYFIVSDEEVLSNTDAHWFLPDTIEVEDVLY